MMEEAYRGRIHLPCVHTRKRIRGEPVPKVWVRATVNSTHPFRRIGEDCFVLLQDLMLEDVENGGISFVDHMYLLRVNNLADCTGGATLTFRAHLSPYTRADGSSSWTLRGVSRVRYYNSTPSSSDSSGSSPDSSPDSGS